jgi:phosphatidate cytidylyltransferase
MLVPLIDGGSRRWGDLGRRTASGLVLAPLALWLLWIGPPAWTVLVTLAGMVLAHEWAVMCRVSPWRAPALSLMACVGGATLMSAGADAMAGLLVLLAGTGAMLARGGRGLAAGVPYLGVAAVALVWLRDDPVAGRWNVLFVTLVVWASDIGAYVVGRLVGGWRLAPVISPGKTWSGAVGGLLAAAAVGWVAWLREPGTSAAHALAVACLLGLISQLGDLLESFIKRRFGVKNSGSLIPGHGGLLDRLDGMLAAGPAAALLASDAGRGTLLWQ